MVLFLLELDPVGARQARSSQPQAPSSDGLAVAQPWIGDLDGMIKRRMIRVLVPYSKTHYFIDEGVQRGVEPNIHAGVKYIRFVIDQYFKDQPMDELNKILFAFASYNAGPARIRQLRAKAQRTGLDPNVWFNNVERVVSARIGRETVQYVSNIYKYYVAYQLAYAENQARRVGANAARGETRR